MTSSIVILLNGLPKHRFDNTLVLKSPEETLERKIEPKTAEAEGPATDKTQGVGNKEDSSTFTQEEPFERFWKTVHPRTMAMPK
jgi:hypothetical protein